VVVAPTTASTLGLPVTAGRSYLLQRPSAPTTSLPVAPVTGTAARTSRALGSATIGLSGNSLPTTGNTVTVTNPGGQTGTVGTPISGVPVHAADSAAGQTLTYAAGGLPAGLSINASTGLIAGTPSSAGITSVTVTATDTTGAVGSATFGWTISGLTSGGTCHIGYAANEWPGGFTANVTINNTGSTTVNGWTLTFSYPGDQKVTNAWNGTVTQSGTTVTAVNAGYNGSIAPGAATTFGFQGTWSANDSAPTAFTLNGAACD